MQTGKQKGLMFVTPIERQTKVVGQKKCPRLVHVHSNTTQVSMSVEVQSNDVKVTVIWHKPTFTLFLPVNNNQMNLIILVMGYYQDHSPWNQKYLKMNKKVINSQKRHCCFYISVKAHISTAATRTKLIQIVQVGGKICIFVHLNIHKERSWLISSNYALRQ